MLCINYNMLLFIMQVKNKFLFSKMLASRPFFLYTKHSTNDRAPGADTQKRPSPAARMFQGRLCIS
ncbi:hypothetical protein BRYFOR_08878 [Marvinbryantia formatexigens DSM 14469]|uniref:Uncharacterized protein n=1 Tax=Marvinbryantia formatexigens DSM 14469 TaxID=478749 RepID=C6LJP1_9FIRM|nr:hypothetical protein BRYFOR_08878 [Marvinbryantia formatexigens DSM 14469]